MEFKKSNSSRDGQPKSTLPQHGYTAVDAQPIRRPPKAHSKTTTDPEPAAAESESDYKKPLRKATSIQSKKGVAAGAIILAVILIIWFVIGQSGEGKTNKDLNDPGYQTVIPDGKSIDQLGGWKRVSPPKTEPVYAYSDTLDSVSISVSQQPLPKTFEGDPRDQVAELAKRFNATDEIDANGTKVYVGTSAKGPQSAIFTKNGLLVLIKSQQKIDDKAWAFYVESLIGIDPTLSKY